MNKPLVQKDTHNMGCFLQSHVKTLFKPFTAYKAHYAVFTCAYIIEVSSLRGAHNDQSQSIKT